LGVGEDNRFLVALDEPNYGKPRIYINGKGDGDLRSSGPGNWDRSAGGNCFVGNVVIDVPYPTGKIPYKFCFYRLKSRQPDRLFYYRATGRAGEVVLDGNRYRVLVLDDNADGRFDDLQNGSLIIDLNQDGNLETSPDSAEYFRLREPFNVRGKVWEVASLSPDGLSITLRPSKADVPIKAYLNPGCSAPEFIAHGLDGKSIDLRAEVSKGHYVLLDFWASWCGPCRGEFSTLRRVYARYRDHGLTVIGVNLDSELAKASDAVQQAELFYPHVFDGQGWKNSVALLYRVHAIPQVYLLDDQLKIVAKNLRGAQLEMRLHDLLGPGDEEAARAADRANH
jgi:thiol-disulfide isomerase/thioredoxin